MVSIRAIYEEGKLRLLDPIALQEGQRVDIQVDLNQSNERDLLQNALADLDIQWADPSTTVDDDIRDDDTLMQEIAAGTKGLAPLSEVIIQERRESP